MEDKPTNQETQIDRLARMIKSEFDLVRSEMHGGFTELRAEMKTAFAGVNKRFAVMGQRIDRLELKVEAHRQETKDAFLGLHRLIGGISATLTDQAEAHQCAGGLVGSALSEANIPFVEIRFPRTLASSPQC